MDQDKKKRAARPDPTDEDGLGRPTRWTLEPSDLASFGIAPPASAEEGAPIPAGSPVWKRAAEAIAASAGLSGDSVAEADMRYVAGAIDAEGI